MDDLGRSRPEFLSRIVLCWHPPPWRSFPGWAIGKDRGGSIPSGRRACMKLGSGIAAVVTGGASGLGEATSRKLASVGVEVAIFDMNAERGEALAAELSGVFCPVDIRSEIGRASCRERVCKFVLISVVAVQLKKQKNNKIV